MADRPVPRLGAPALAAFVADMRAICAQGTGWDAAFDAARAPLARLLADADLQNAARDWPECRRENWLLYEDPDYGFVIDGLVKGAGQKTSVHDHAHIWVLYGVLSGNEDITHYRRTDGGHGEGPAQLAETGREGVVPGVLDLVPPFAIHAECAGPQGSTAIILRSERPDRVDQGRYDAASGRWTLSPGIRQIPFPL